jgi:polysaccharide pyruvyl transferase WcaK-like protein
MRQWFHFVSSILPYELARKEFEQRSQDEMRILVDAFVALIQRLKKDKQARFLLVSAYKPDVVPWEDDTPWLKMIKGAFLDDKDILVVESQLSVMEYFYLMSRLDMMIGMRLHSVLIALRFGVPAINISYTLKGKDIMDHLGLDTYVCSLDDFIATPEVVSSKVVEIFDQYDRVKTHVQAAITQAMTHNEAVLKELLSRL